MSLTRGARIYLDNAATTRMDDEVLRVMLPYLQDDYGNPSSIYSYGREARLAVENARREIAAQLGIERSALIFTSGGTEANNLAITAAIRHLGCSHILYSATEHHSVLHTIDHFATEGVTAGRLDLLPNGAIDLASLEAHLADLRRGGIKALVCTMHANNETGLVTDIDLVGNICRSYGAVFFSDCVVTIGHYPMELGRIPVDLASAAAHKFHGPKGTGLLYVRPGLEIGPLLHGGGQERGRRAGTENVAGIVGMAKALTIADRNRPVDEAFISQLRFRLIDGLRKYIPGVSFNSDLTHGIHTILSASFQRTTATESLLLDLDQAGICVSSGSACLAGAGSHVMQQLGRAHRINIRFSFSKYNDLDQIAQVIQTIQRQLSSPAVTHPAE